jgi:hypothetical protein
LSSTESNAALLPASEDLGRHPQLGAVDDPLGVEVTEGQQLRHAVHGPLAAACLLEGAQLAAELLDACHDLAHEAPRRGRVRAVAVELDEKLIEGSSLEGFLKPLPTPAQLPAELAATVRGLLQRGEKIEAIKLVRERMKLDLKNAK